MAYNNSKNDMAANEDSGDLGLQGDFHPILQKDCSTTGFIYEKNRKRKRERWVGSIYVQKINVGIG